MTWSTRFNISHRLANKWHVGRVFLAGVRLNLRESLTYLLQDSAHIHSPVGGQGMNTGLCDAYNLAWKLSLVVHGLSPYSIMSSYDSERSSAASGVVAATDRSTRMMNIQYCSGKIHCNALLGILLPSKLEINSCHF
jgi:2-polyprenyl-6-methoxyphenol hydroxylase-like FAD-dependent oxidoreductase